MQYGSYILDKYTGSGDPEHALEDELRRLREEYNARSTSLLRSHEGTLSADFSTDVLSPHSLSQIASTFQRELQSGKPFAIPPGTGTKENIEGIILPITDEYWLLLHTPIRRVFKRIITSEQFAKLKALLLELSLNSLQKEHNLVQVSLSALLNTIETDNPFQLTLNSLLSMFNSTLGTIWEYHNNLDFGDAAYLTLEGSAGHSMSEYAQTCLPEGHGLVWRSLATSAPKHLVLTELSRDDLANQNLFPLYNGNSVLLVRLEDNQTTIGVACIASEKPLLPEKIRNSLAIFEKLAVLEITNKQLRQKAHVLERVSEIIPTSDQDQTEFCREVVTVIRQLINPQAVSIFLRPELDPRKPTLELRAASVDESFEKSAELKRFEANLDIPIYSTNGASLTGTIAQTNKPILSNSVSSNPQNSGKFREIEDATNDTWLGVPIHDENGMCIGVVRCTGKLRLSGGEKRNYVFNRFDMFVLTHFSEIIAPMFRTLKTLKNLNQLTHKLEVAERIREHELKAPLAVIAANASFVHRYLDDKSATSKARRLKSIISDAEMCAFLLKDTRVPKGIEFKESLRYLSPYWLLTALVDYLKRQIQQRSRLAYREKAGVLELDFDIPPFMSVNFSGNAPKTLLNKSLIQRAFYNIGINAIKYGVPNGRLEISASESENPNVITIDFVDTGIGIPQGEAGRIFDEDYRGSNVRDGFSGEGLGLSIAKEIVEAHGGTIMVVREANPTHFQVRLPIIRPQSKHLQQFDHPSLLRFDKPLKRKER